MRLPKPKFGDLLYVKWFDAWHACVDGYVEELAEENPILQLDRCGFFLQEANGYVVMTTELSPQFESARWTHAIPKVNIIKLEIVRKWPSSQKKKQTAL